jgi:hypothetical protein
MKKFNKEKAKEHLTEEFKKELDRCLENCDKFDSWIQAHKTGKKYSEHHQLFRYKEVLCIITTFDIKSDYFIIASIKSDGDLGEGAGARKMMNFKDIA